MKSCQRVTCTNGKGYVIWKRWNKKVYRFCKRSKHVIDRNMLVGGQTERQAQFFSQTDTIHQSDTEGQKKVQSHHGGHQCSVSTHCLSMTPGTHINITMQTALSSSPSPLKNENHIGAKPLARQLLIKTRDMEGDIPLNISWHDSKMYLHKKTPMLKNCVKGSSPS